MMIGRWGFMLGLDYAATLKNDDKPKSFFSEVQLEYSEVEATD